ncbi:MAG: EamA family transporter [Pelagibacterales bacterium]|nr:EamA family transporter [Pelagibacterales bacterium]|tara:strand:- start:49 stop:882 length:834 start_codon:yes stop_codon:yes gene_type:complete
MKNLFIITLVMTAFAANSIITRLALSSNLIGPSNFALLRAGSAALILVLLVIFIHKKIPKFKINSIVSALALVGYLVGFSFAYLTINTGVGALILFGGSMIVMFTGALLIKEHISILRFIGVFLSLIGLYILTDPRFGDNSLFGIILMFLAAFSWGIYSILGHGQNNPLSNTAINFVLALLLIIPIALFIPDQTNTSPYGILLAIISGSITSGLGYTLWYWILPKINITSASIAQLSVPLIAALGGYLFISEILNWQFYIASFLILGGIGLPYFFKK